MFNDPLLTLTARTRATGLDAMQTLTADATIRKRPQKAGVVAFRPGFVRVQEAVEVGDDALVDVIDPEAGFGPCLGVGWERSDRGPPRYIRKAWP